MKKTVLASISVLILDILTKQIVIHTMIESQSIPIIKKFFYITYAQNTGIAFSILENKIPLIIMMTILVIFLIFKYLKDNEQTSFEKICYGLVIGGAVGNLLDRIVYGYVIDFLDFHIFSYHFPIFNISDTFIVIGILLLLLISLKESKKESSDQNDNYSRRNKKNR